MNQKKSWWDTFGKWNFALFFRLVSLVSTAWARRILYIGLADRSIYEDTYENPILNIQVFGKTFPNPIGISAGFDPNFKYNDELIHFGFGFEEFGTFTLAPSRAYAKLRYLPSQKGLLYDTQSFRNNGIKFAQQALINRRHLPHIAGINISSNFDLKDDNNEIAQIYTQIERELIECVQLTAPYCDYIALNLSHPTLPISSLLINTELLEQILQHLKESIKKVAPIANPKLLVKVPLNALSEHIPLLCDAFLNSGVDGVIIGGYLQIRKDSRRRLKITHAGHMCGAPIRQATLQLVGQFYKILRGRLPIIASGGVFTAEDAFEQIKAGASLIQIHSAIIYEGPSVARKINRRLAALLSKNGYHSLIQAVGADIRNQEPTL